MARTKAILLLVCSLILMSGSVATAASIAHVGQNVSVLTQGLVAENSDGAYVVCSGQKIYGIKTYYFDASIPEDQRDPNTNAVAISLQIDGKDRLMLTIDPQEGTALAFYGIGPDGVILYVEAWADSTSPNMDAACKAALGDLLK